MDKMKEILKPFSPATLTIKETGQTIAGEISKSWLFHQEVFCQILTNDKLEKFTNQTAIITAHDGIERTCIINHHDNSFPIVAIELRSVDLNR